jgi:formylglycine-generating enzyme required for sulfatase activity
MEPLTTSLLAAITAAAGAILGGAAEAAGDDAWAAAKHKLAGWVSLDERRKGAAFDQALRDAVAALRQSASRPEQVDRALSLLTADSPDGRAFRAVAIEELLFSGEPDFGRVLDEYRRNLRFEDFIRAWDTPGNRFVATSRIAGYEDAPLDKGLFAETTITPFDDEQIRAFTLRWSRAFERAGLAEASGPDPLLEQRAGARAVDLDQAIFGSPHITALARNPLLLTILAIIHNQGARLPDRRVDLYRLCVEALAETWNRARSLSGQEIDVYLGDEKLNERFVVNLLGPVALRIHAENPGGIVEEQDLERWLTETLIETDGLAKGRAGRLAREFISLVNRETGLLQERGQRRYSFLHLTFEEYLAARGLLESATLADPDAEIHQRAGDAGWREVLRLAVASANQREASRLLLHLLAAPADTKSHGRPTILAGECLLDIGRNGATQRAWSAVLDALIALLRDSAAPMATRVETGQLLGCLGDPRLLDLGTGEAVGLGDYEAVDPYWCPVEAGPFWFGDERVTGGEIGKPSRFDPMKLKRASLPHGLKIARYPVTNAEFQVFLAANGPKGYDPAQPWWTKEAQRFLSPQGKRWTFDDVHQDKAITHPRFWNNPRYNSPIQPVVGVSWYEAVAYCNWLTQVGHERGWLPADEEIRLPTSLEWERAARHIDHRPYPWGDPPPTANHANCKAAGVGAPSPVGCFPAGRAVCGAEDLIGNVWEWLTTDDQNMSNLTVISPKKDFTSTERALLSSTYYEDYLDQLCCGARNSNYPFYGYTYWGFRVLQSLRAH